MPVSQLRPDSLILYKNRPGRVVHLGSKKLDIELENGQAISVRPKDVTLLHPGPLRQLADLRPPRGGEVQTAWELLAGSVTSLAELAELAYGAFTPATSWATWQLIVDGLYFSGTPDAVLAHSPEAVAEEQATRAARAAEEAAWQAFVGRIDDGRFQPDDRHYLEEVANLARGQAPGSRVLRALGQTESPENAHAWLLELGYWDETVNPYPLRAGLPVTLPDVDLPALPDEPRLDLTHLPALAIDDEGSRDPDDALSLENGRLWVHIADVAALVPPDSPADQEARGRGANLYLPEGTVTMLPPAATERLGLGLAERSPALSFGLDLDEEGQVIDLTITPSWVRVTRLTYADAEARQAEPLLASLAALADRFGQRRQRRNAVELELPEVKVRVEDGTVSIKPLPAYGSRNTVREAMLMVGEAVAAYAIRHQIPLPFTIQDPPSQTPPPATTPSEMFAVRRLMRAGQQTIRPGSHAGLGLPHYVQATSPLRRYLDLVVHQQLRAYLRGDPLLDEQTITQRIGAADAVTGSVRAVERRANDHWKLVYLRRHDDWQGEGVVVDRRGSYDLVLIPELAWETEIYQAQPLPPDSWVTLALVKVRLAERLAHFRPVD